MRMSSRFLNKDVKEQKPYSKRPLTQLSIAETSRFPSLVYGTGNSAWFAFLSPRPCLEQVPGIKNSNLAFLQAPAHSISQCLVSV